MDFSSTLPTDLPGQISQVSQTVRDGASFLLISHLRPDGDAIGSLAGLAKSLRKLGKRVEIGLADPVPSRFSFLLEDEPILKPGNLEITHDVVIVLDAGDLPRTGFEKDLEGAGAILVNIDHHASNTMFGEVNLFDPEASSTCEMVCTLLQTGGFPLDNEVAQGLYLGLMTDSRFFQNERLRSSAHFVGARLLETGLDTSPILARLNSSRTLGEIRALGLGLSRLRVAADPRLVVVVLQGADLEKVGATWENVFSCGLFGYLTSIEGVLVGAGFVEGVEGKSFCELRSRGGFDVKEIAVSFGGGGHLAASGCNQTVPLADFAGKIEAAILERLAGYPRPQSEDR